MGVFWRSVWPSSDRLTASSTGWSAASKGMRDGMVGMAVAILHHLHDDQGGDQGGGTRDLERPRVGNAQTSTSNPWVFVGWGA